MNSPDLLSVDELSVSYEGVVRELKGASLTIKSGQVIGVLGPNGAGKSTLLKAIAGLVPPQSGTVRLKEEDMGGVAPHKRVERGLVLLQEGRHAFGGMSVEENLLLSLHRSMAWNRIDSSIAEALEDLYSRFTLLGDRRAQPASSLSGGERQMLALGRAVALRPVVLLLDEPSLGLSPVAANTVFAAIESIAEDGTGLILVEQSVDRTLRIASSVRLISQGALGEPRDPEALTTVELRDTYLGTPDGATGPTSQE